MNCVLVISPPLLQGLKLCDTRSALFLLKATKEFKEKSSTLALALAERMGLPESSLALPWDAPVYRNGLLEWELGGIRFLRPGYRSLVCSVTAFFESDSLWLTCQCPLEPVVPSLSLTSPVTTVMHWQLQ